MESVRTLPLPKDPVLAEWARSLNEDGHWAYLVDPGWHIVFATDELRLTLGETGKSTTIPIGHNWFSTEMVRYRTAAHGGSVELPEYRRDMFRRFGTFALFGMPGGRASLRNSVDPDLWDLVEVLEPVNPPPVLSNAHIHSFVFGGANVRSSTTTFRIDDRHGGLAGFVLLIKPAAGMSQLATAAATQDLGYLERLRMVERPDRRPAAIMMADLEGSTSLSRRLSTAQFFSFGRRLVRAADRCIVGEGGIVGRHAGDGVVAFFLMETAGSESAAARSCIAASKAVRAELGEVAIRSEIPHISLRFGLHWGATLYVGRILTAGRSEVTALGDEVNEAARIEACATGGRSLASKALIERLNPADSEGLGIFPARIAYTVLADLSTATEKARRDAPSIAVCDV